ncbi:hypothetical protein N780_07305 [Pontibacillus chungwhensis BH030062]|uniref:DUF445 family protein n=1 Tax=Pontibacillus chungwhensis BH030062 TaxID=1385513 RepID=A0A0A2UU44_9BACI|nr:DUF445 family protein [Pontibacillus chungwhensis]KGP90026.1 hypothetical protein N780_07305 [Pontibacillus chungwhensis BH030062]
MNTFLLILMMIAIGALIGGMTNSLAIRMLFRPFKAKYIFNKRVPFTPGLIPKRHDELAEQLGKMVTDHLLTPEGIQRKLDDDTFQQQVVEYAQKEVTTFLTSERSLQHVLNDFQIPLDQQVVESKLKDFTQGQVESYMKDARAKSVRELIGDNAFYKGKAQVGKASEYILRQIDDFISSEEGRAKIGAIIEDYLEGQGFLGNMISSFMGNQGLADKVQPAVSDFLNSEDAHYWLKEVLHTEWDKWMEKPFSVYEEKLGLEGIPDAISEQIVSSIPTDVWLERSIAEHTKNFQPYIVETLVPQLVGKIGGALSSRLPSIMETLHLSEVVRKEVQAFPVERLEDIVLGISKREFKMITYLGALLGGVIGLIQAGIILLIG